MREESKTLLFATGVCLACSLLLSGAAKTLEPMQKSNEEFDIKRNIVKAFGIDTSAMERPAIEATFETHVKQATASTPEGEQPIYTWTEDGAEAPSKYAFPISGKGLWSMLYGYLSLESDLETIAGISFYKHGETPGLGAEIEKAWFQKQFTGKKLYHSGKPAEFAVAKPGTASGDSAVDGISGATLTGKGVQQLLRRDAALYADYFNNIKGN